MILSDFFLKSKGCITKQIGHWVGYILNGKIQVNLDMTDSMGPGKLVRHMKNLSYAYDEYLICIGLGPSI